MNMNDPNRNFRHGMFEIEQMEVITYDGVPINDMPRAKLITLVGTLLRDLKKRGHIHVVGEEK